MKKVLRQLKWKLKQLESEANANMTENKIRLSNSIWASSIMSKPWSEDNVSLFSGHYS